MPQLSKTRRLAVQREEKKRLEREANSKNVPLEPMEGLIVEAKAPQPRGGSTISKWRWKNRKTKKSRAAQMQPSVLKFFPVSNGNIHNRNYCGRLTTIGR